MRAKLNTVAAATAATFLLAACGSGEEGGQAASGERAHRSAAGLKPREAGPATGKTLTRGRTGTDASATASSSQPLVVWMATRRPSSPCAHARSHTARASPLDGCPISAMRCTTSPPRSGEDADPSGCGAIGFLPIGGLGGRARRCRGKTTGRGARLQPFDKTRPRRDTQCAPPAAAVRNSPESQIPPAWMPQR